MSNFALSMAKQTITNQVGSVKSSLVKTSGAHSNINWDELNYPPLLKLFHYTSAELSEPHKGIVRKINIGFLLIVFLSLLNIINSIIQASMGYDGIRIFYSFLNLFIFVTVTCYCFYRGYMGLIKDEYMLKFYKILQGLLIILFFVFSIIDAGCFNGWVRVSSLFKDGNPVPGVIAIIESVIYIVYCLLTAFCIYKVQTTPAA